MINYKILDCRPDCYQNWYQQANLYKDRGYYQEALYSYGAIRLV